METQYALLAAHDGLYPSAQGGLVTLKAGEVWKYGTTANPDGFGRYPKVAMAVLGLQMVPQVVGNYAQVMAAEKLQIINYVQIHGVFPPGNTRFK
jgi:hypothetical protein